ncbi:YwqG family protein [Mycolicibacterium peregrinum]|uniref:DUF1963 domain-containing protein n=1 Tax=Mycolicibacterium peregrinum TaxID=43304 RepID=A0A4Z0HQF2_MYCPR|nr:YwqG family protein [Mycolicibacterium peregrinum]TGB42267.1 DUF1963 domain-containing protein [Mycolicibacterium peregrinum]TGB43764.1 DUF1963 domain-containing protein [Mycolicibacterium peregrinum]
MLRLDSRNYTCRTRGKKFRAQMESIETVRERVAAAGREHLGDELGAQWSSMLTEGTRLRASHPPARHQFTLRPNVSAAPVGRLGGPAPLARGAEWPIWSGYGPLAHIATLDCQALHRYLPEALKAVGFPRDGLLSFFYFDGQVDDGAEVVGALFGTSDGVRVMHTPGDEPVVLTESPSPITAYRELELRAEPILTWPTWEHPDLHDENWPAAGWSGVFETLDAVRQATPGPLHQIGGHPDPVQGPVEVEIAYGQLTDGGGHTLNWSDPAVTVEARDWQLLAQFDTDDDAGFMWGDCGILYFMIRPQDLAAGAFDRVSFTWQCC